MTGTEPQTSPFQIVPNSPAFLQDRKSNSSLAPTVPEVCETNVKKMHPSPMIAAVVPSTPQSVNSMVTIFDQRFRRQPQTSYPISECSKSTTPIFAPTNEQEVPGTPYQDRFRKDRVKMFSLSSAKRKDRANIKRQRIFKLAVRRDTKAKCMTPLFNEDDNIFD